MAYNDKLASRIREYLSNWSELKVMEKKIFGGLAFLVNDKMCINVSEDNLMCRFNPILQEELSRKKGFQPMIMKGKTYRGYCYVEPEGFENRKDFEYWINLCIDFNDSAKSSKKT